ncbi:cyclophilin type peptidyl-prolyl cis-trans isomerase/CLD family protein [Bacillus atrophaeus subsp. globigii]|uniref:Resolvase domain protein n=4 Tax=Bacillus atrophaeus TaxID=1452 RepID=A0ABM5LYS8_BACA1|nr:Resolvase domain protein [Bacillus atrophaeus 1942]AIK47651.1 cyclophilin type peptidyl-prolyl cis-trans isomerase/CLD family protein [Bacillus atrophaeus subsp. globigii]AMR62360.1 resolvase [Bacillus subtilis subsp. globigii]EIM12031.1 resolvase domain-containing protein [Bacillus atrophaeus C89]KFK84599.1 cyclophilin type peptidyl-prolyl cis-trans isomerase/CLD family protein [Bacillus atrophaeus]
MASKLRVWASYRVSTDRQGAEGDDIPLQKAQCHAYADKNGWEITKELTEKISGYKTAIEDRNTLKVIKQGAVNGEFDILLLYHSDRLGRQMEYSLYVASLYELGVEVWTVKEGEIKNQDHADSLMNFIRYWQSEGESKKTSMRVSDAMRQLNEVNEEGAYLGGTVPYGYMLEDTGKKRNSKKDKTIKKLVVNPDEAKIVKMMFEWVTDRSLGGALIAQELNAMGATNRGKQWRHNTITRMLRNPAYMGYKRYNTTKNVGTRGNTRKEVKRDEWLLQPFNPNIVIVSEEQFKKVQDIMDKRAKSGEESSGEESSNESREPAPVFNGIAVNKNRVPTSSKLLLSGMAICGYCGKKLNADFTIKKNTRVDGSFRKHRTYRYTCNNSKNNPNGHNQRAFGAVTIDKQVEEEVLSTISTIDLDAFDAEKDSFDFEELDSRKIQLKELEGQYAEVSKALSSVESLFDDVMLGKSSMSLDFVSKKMEDYGARKIELLSKIDALNKEIKEAEVKSTDLEKLKYQLDNWVETYKNSVSLAEKKSMLYKVIDEVVISKETIIIRFNITIEKALEGAYNPVNQGRVNDPTGTGAGGPGYTIKCETEGNPHTHEAGALSMAHAGKDTGGSQFFIVHEPQPHLNGVHTVFGKVTSGLEFAKGMSNGDVMKEVRVQG